MLCLIIWTRKHFYENFAALKLIVIGQLNFELVWLTQTLVDYNCFDSAGLRMLTVYNHYKLPKNDKFPNTHAGVSTSL